MAENLVIVESPAKAKTIEKYLGKKYKVIASMGHVRDLPRSQMGVDVDNDYEPKYITIRGKGPVVKELKKHAKKAKNVYLASDPDREGEAIAWHLANILDLEDSNENRVVFNEITKDAVKDSFKHPRGIEMQLVDAQQARRILDRLVGYNILKKVCLPEEYNRWLYDLLLIVKTKLETLSQKNIGKLKVNLDIKNLNLTLNFYI